MGLCVMTTSENIVRPVIAGLALKMPGYFVLCSTSPTLHVLHQDIVACAHSIRPSAA